MNLCIYEYEALWTNFKFYRSLSYYLIIIPDYLMAILGVIYYDWDMSYVGKVITVCRNVQSSCYYGTIVSHITAMWYWSSVYKISYIIFKVFVCLSVCLLVSPINNFGPSVTNLVSNINSKIFSQLNICLSNSQLYRSFPLWFSVCPSAPLSVKIRTERWRG